MAVRREGSMAARSPWLERETFEIIKERNSERMAREVAARASFPCASPHAVDRV